MPNEIRLWPDAAPGSEDWTHDEVSYTDAADGGHRIRNVVVPTLTAYPPVGPSATSTAVIVAPGGGFRMLAWDYEGADVAEWLAARGITAFVLKYRLVDTGPTPEAFRRAMTEWWTTELMDETGGSRQLQAASDLGPIVPLAVADGEQAVRLVRDRSAEFGVDADKLGFLGFSAGAFVAASVGVSADAAARPSFIAPIYGGSVQGAVPADAPPLFSAVASDDPVCLDTTLRLVDAWRAAGRPADLHLYSRGGHGFGVRKLGLPVDGWLGLFHEWMESL